jgi:hypothetical protein
VLTSLRTPAFAQYGEPCEEGCTYVAVITKRNGTLTCSECPSAGPPGCDYCAAHSCTGPACARVTSMTDEGTHVTVCHDCDLTTGATCHTCLETGECTCVGFERDERCVRLDRLLDCTGDEQWTYPFSCQAC